MIDPCDPDCPLCVADREARERYLAAQRKYNTSAKGQKRNRAYEDRHPERKLRWEPARNALRGPMHPPPDGPMHPAEDVPPDPAVFGPEP